MVLLARAAGELPLTTVWKSLNQSSANSYGAKGKLQRGITAKAFAHQINEGRNAPGARACHCQAAGLGCQTTCLDPCTSLIPLIARVFAGVLAPGVQVQAALGFPLGERRHVALRTTQSVTSTPNWRTKRSPCRARSAPAPARPAHRFRRRGALWRVALQPSVRDGLQRHVLVVPVVVLHAVLVLPGVVLRRRRSQAVENTDEVPATLSVHPFSRQTRPSPQHRTCTTVPR